MSILLDTSVLPSRTGVPNVPEWAVPRARLAARLDVAAAGLLTMISGPAGAGKTTGVAAWARDLHPSVGVIWVDPGSASTDGLPLDQIAAELDRQSRVIVVHDDFPAAPSVSLIGDLEALLSQPDRRLSIVVICSAPPISPVRHPLDPRDLTTINFDDLVMDENEVRLVLDQHGVEASEATIRAVLEHTKGWAAGVELAAIALAQLSRSIPWAVQQAWAARTVVKSMTVPRILAGAGSDILQPVIGLKEFGEPEPILLARDSGPSRQHAPFMTSAPEPATAAVDRWRGDDHAQDGIFVVPLTTRETDVLRLLAQLCSNEEIAADLVLSLNTVKTHMRSLFQKLSVSRRADAVRRGRALGLC